MPSTLLPLSLFELLRDDLGESVEVIRCTKATLVHISHALEDVVLRHRLPALIFTGFQESSHWREETERYRALSEVVQQVCIFAGGDLPPESGSRQLHVTLAGDDPLRQEWFLAIISERFSAVLCGQDRLAEAASEATREFDTIWSFEPAVIERVLDRVEEVVGRYRPERLEALRAARAATPIRGPDPLLITRLTGDLIHFEEKLHAALFKATRRLEGEMRWRAELIETLVHDLRTPMQALLQTIEFVRQQPELEREERDEMLGMAALSAGNLHNLIQVLLDTNRLEGDRLRLDVTPVAPQRLVDEAVAAMQPLLTLARLRFEVQVDPVLKVLFCDVSLIGRVLQNLIGNAIKHTPAGGLIRLELTRSEDRRAMIRVRDSGAGIGPAALPHIFERYYREGRGGQRGSGIGLYFCRLAVEAHGGSIRADSQLAVGTTVTISLPLRPAA